MIVLILAAPQISTLADSLYVVLCVALYRLYKTYSSVTAPWWAGNSCVCECNQVKFASLPIGSRAICFIWAHSHVQALILMFTWSSTPKKKRTEKLGFQHRRQEHGFILCIGHHYSLNYLIAISQIHKLTWIESPNLLGFWDKHESWVPRWSGVTHEYSVYLRTLYRELMRHFTTVSKWSLICKFNLLYLFPKYLLNNKLYCVVPVDCYWSISKMTNKKPKWP